MPQYQLDFKRRDGAVFATHEIIYKDDNAAIAAGHSINGFPTIGASFEVWRDGQRIHLHRNVPLSSGDCPFDTSSGQHATALQVH